MCKAVGNRSGRVVGLKPAAGAGAEPDRGGEILCLISASHEVTVRTLIERGMRADYAEWFDSLADSVANERGTAMVVRGGTEQVRRSAGVPCRILSLPTRTYQGRTRGRKKL